MDDVCFTTSNNLDTGTKLVEPFYFRSKVVETRLNGYRDFFRYVGLCAGIKILALALFLIDWWLVRRRRQLEDQAPSFTVNEFVGSIISLDKCEYVRWWYLQEQTRALHE